MINRSTLLFAALAVVSPVAAQIAVSDYFFFKGVLFSQTSQGAITPFATDPYYFNVGINGQQASDINPAPSFTGPVLGAPSGTLISTTGTHWDFKQGFSSKAALDAAFPNGAYKIFIPGQAPGGGVTLAFDKSGIGNNDDGYSSNSPMVTNTNLTWSGGNLQINPLVTTRLTFTPFQEFLDYTPPPNDPHFRQVLAFFADSGPNPTWKIERSSFGGAGFDFFDIDPNFLTGGVTYRTVLTYDIYSGFNSTAVPGAEGVAMFSQQLQFFITATAIPEPSTVTLFAGLAGLGTALWRRARRRVS